jgi:hypothetical protein
MIRRMRSRLAIVVFAAALAAPLRAAEQTWTGVISDSACGLTHEAAAEGADKMTDQDCTLACVKGGSAYVFVSDGKVYKIANQTVDGLAAHAGKTVQVTGEMEGGSVRIAQIK